MLIKDPPVEIIDNLYMLGVNAYPCFLFKGENEGLIFEGATGAVGRLIMQQLDEMGLGGNYVKRLVVTHAHPDHVMAIPAFQKMNPEIKVLASEASAQTLGSEQAMTFFCGVDGALTDSLGKMGAIKEEHTPEPLSEMKITVDEIIKEGDTIDVDGQSSFSVIETPGHSYCSLSFYEASRKVLIISDATGYYMPELKYWWPNYFADYGKYISSMERLAKYDAEVLCLSHNGVIQGAEEIRNYFAGAIADTKEYHQRIIDEIKAGKDPRQLAGELGSEVYEKTQLLPLDFFQKNCGMLIKRSLKHEGMEQGKK